MPQIPPFDSTRHHPVSHTNHQQTKLNPTGLRGRASSVGAKLFKDRQGSPPPTVVPRYKARKTNTNPPGINASLLNNYSSSLSSSSSSRD